MSPPLSPGPQIGSYFPTFPPVRPSPSQKAPRANVVCTFAPGRPGVRFCEENARGNPRFAKEPTRKLDRRNVKTTSAPFSASRLLERIAESKPPLPIHVLPTPTPLRLPRSRFLPGLPIRKLRAWRGGCGERRPERDRDRSRGTGGGASPPPPSSRPVAEGDLSEEAYLPGTCRSSWCGSEFSRGRSRS